jgi:hypothetical protein
MRKLIATLVAGTPLVAGTALVAESIQPREQVLALAVTGAASPVAKQETKAARLNAAGRAEPIKYVSTSAYRITPGEEDAVPVRTRSVSLSSPKPVDSNTGARPPAATVNISAGPGFEQRWWPDGVSAPRQASTLQEAFAVKQAALVQEAPLAKEIVVVEEAAVEAEAPIAKHAPVAKNLSLAKNAPILAKATPVGKEAHAVKRAAKEAFARKQVSSLAEPRTPALVRLAFAADTAGDTQTTPVPSVVAIPESVRSTAAVKSVAQAPAKKKNTARTSSTRVASLPGAPDASPAVSRSAATPHASIICITTVCGPRLFLIGVGF